MVASIGVNIGTEIDGKNNNFERPVLIIKKFDEENLWILPITNSPNTRLPSYMITDNKISGHVLLHQLRMINIGRLIRLVSKVNDNEFEEIRRRIVRLLDLYKRNASGAGG
jgi:mRNA interferase MazF